MAYVIKRTGLYSNAMQSEDGRQMGNLAFYETVAEGISDFDEACRTLLRHKGKQGFTPSGYEEVSVVSPQGLTVAWLDEGLNLVKRRSARIVPFR